MADYFVAISEDGIRFMLRSDGTWEPDVEPVSEPTNEIRTRSSNWGDSMAQVKASESHEPDYVLPDVWGYKTNVGGFPATLCFMFVNGMLHTGWYSFEQKNSNDNDFLSDFESLKKLICLKYGEEKEILVLWSNDLYREDNNERGLAVSVGHHSMFVIWEDMKTNITLKLTGDNYEISLMLIYRSKQLHALANETSVRKKLLGL